MTHLRSLSHRRRIWGLVVAAAVTLDDAEVGDVAETIVEARFTEDVTATDYKAGVTIKLNAISQTINDATRQGDHSLVYFTIAAAVDVDDTVTWEYDDDLGDYEDAEGNPMADVAATSATNYVGSHARFDLADDSAWIGAL